MLEQGRDTDWRWLDSVCIFGSKTNETCGQIYREREKEGVKEVPEVSGRSHRDRKIVQVVGEDQELILDT